MKKRLLLMLPMLHQGGFERVAVATARLLAQDFDVALCIFSDKNIHYDVRGLEIINLDVPSERSRLKKAVNVLKRVRRARRVKRERGIDITYSFGNTANPVNIFSRAGDRVITGLRCATDLENPWIVRRCVRRSDLVLSCSGEIAALLARDFGAERTQVIRNPLDAEGIRQKARERSVLRGDGIFSIVTMGRDDLIKSHWHLLKAFSLVVKKHPEARLSIIGAGKYTAYRKLAEELGIAGQVNFTGALTNPFPEVAAADLYVLASNREGFPNALLEAMALGLPVIAADCRTGPREIVLSDEEQAALTAAAPPGTSVKETLEGEYGILVPDMSPELDVDPTHIEEGERALAKQVIRMIEDEAHRAGYRERALLRASRYAPENYRRELKEILEAL